MQHEYQRQASEKNKKSLVGYNVPATSIQSLYDSELFLGDLIIDHYYVKFFEVAMYKIYLFTLITAQIDRNKLCIGVLTILN